MADIVQIIAEIGYEKLGVQRLQGVMLGVQQRKRGAGSRITFACDDVSPGAVAPLGPRDALIVWCDAKEIDAALERIKARATTATPDAPAGVSEQPPEAR